MTRSLHPPMAHCRQRVRFAATWREEFFEVPLSNSSHFALRSYSNIMKPVALPPGSARQADQFGPCPGGGMDTISRVIFLIGLLSGPLCSVASSSPPHSLTISTRCGLRAVRRSCRWRYESGSDGQGSWPRSERPRSLPVEFRGRAPWRSRWTYGPELL